VRVLVDTGADLDAGYAAVRKHSMDMTRILLESRADVGSVFGGESAISYARKHASQRSIEFRKGLIWAEDWDNIVKILERDGAGSQRQLQERS
jgi:hypothetical protein